jgi:phage recombination protein Bet
MANDLAAPSPHGIPALAMDEEQLYRVLESSVYPGAKRDSIALVVGYCRAQNLDPLQKPVHIVPMSVKVAGQKEQNGKDKYEYRDVIMPGVSSYRTTAARTKQHAGTSEPEYGPDKVMRWGDDNELVYPEWCRVTVIRRLSDGTMAQFSAIERWTENYATVSRDSTVPNTMWRKRAYGQLSKCAEAQALRRAFPEVGAAQTAEELEGKTIGIDDAVEHAESLRRTPAPRVAAPAAAAPAAAAPAPPPATVATEEIVGAGERKWIESKLAGLKMTLEAVAKEAGFSVAPAIDKLSVDQFTALREKIIELQAKA